LVEQCCRVMLSLCFLCGGQNPDDLAVHPAVGPELR
jgi:hypothetical protein